MAGRQVAAHVPEFLQVEVLCALRGLDTEGSVAALAADPDRIGALHVIRQREEGLGGRGRRLDPCLGQGVVGNHREAIARE